MANVSEEVARNGAKTLDYIKDKLLRPALTSHFAVSVAGPSNNKWTNFLSQQYRNPNNIDLSSKAVTEIVNLSCSEATLPGSSLATHELNNDRTGVTERHVYRRLYDDRIDLTFYVNANGYYTIKFFETWMKYIVNENRNADPVSGLSVNSPNFYYRMKYPEDYYGALSVIKLERDYSSQLKYTFKNAFPISINSMPVSYDASSLLKCTVSFNYSRYFIDELSIPQNTLPAQNSNSPGNPENNSQAPTPESYLNQYLDLGSPKGFPINPGTLGTPIGTIS